MDPVRIGVAGDFHGNLLWAVSQVRAMGEKLKDEPRKIILHAGDFGVWPGGWKYLTAVEHALALADATLWFIDGNHEDHSQVARWASQGKDAGWTGIVPALVNDLPLRRIFHLTRGYRWTWQDRAWLALGGAVSVDKAARTEGVSWWPGEAITDADEAHVIAGGHADVLFTHDRPASAAISLPPAPSWWRDEDLVRSDAHRERLQRVVDAVRPDYLIHGHYHQGGPWWTTHSRAGGDYKVCSLDCDGKQGNWGILDVKTMKWEK